MEPWIEAARAELVSRRNPEVGWGYRIDSQPAVEPSVLACLALLATDSLDTAEETRSVVRDVAVWLDQMQRSDGSVGVTASLRAVTWPTPFAILLWSRTGGFLTQIGQSADWLLETQGTTPEEPPDSPIGHDTTIPGWPWILDTHSWLEPTSLTILALRLAGRGEHQRVRQGEAMIRDRAVPGGGWNYGNSSVFGAALRARPAPTGLGLLALSAGGVPADDSVEHAIRFLQETLPRIRSGQSLCWGLLGLSCWARRPTRADEWLEEAHGPATGRPTAALELSYLLLGASRTSLELLGLRGRNGESR